MGDNNIKSNLYIHFSIISAIMLLSGLMQLVTKIRIEGDPKTFEIILHTITTLGGVAFLIVAMKSKKQSRL